MSRFGDFPKQINVPIPTDETGMVGRECPNAECEGYFKLQPGTGLTGDDLDCVCPYCGHRGKPDQFWTKEQIEYAKSYTPNMPTLLRPVFDAVWNAAGWERSFNYDENGKWTRRD
jgi:hypothetical protein